MILAETSNPMVLIFSANDPSDNMCYSVKIDPDIAIAGITADNCYSCLRQA